MTMFQRKAVKRELDRQNEAADAHADRLVGTVQQSKWTAALLILVVFAAIAGVVALVWALL